MVQMFNMHGIGRKLLKAVQSFYVDSKAKSNEWEQAVVIGFRLVLRCDRVV